MRSLWTLGGGVAGAFLGYATLTSRDNFWIALVYIGAMAAGGAAAGWAWGWQGNGGGHA